MFNLSPRTMMCNAFMRFVSLSQTSPYRERLCSVAVQALRHEKEVENLFRVAIEEQYPEVRVESQYPMDSFVGDLRILSNGTWLASVEVKAPMTNHDGVKNKTRKKEHLPKDVGCLECALGHGSASGFEFVALLESYGLDSSGKVIPANARSIRQYEAEIGAEYGIKWPTRHDYLHSSGEEEVCSQAAGLGLRKIQGWKRVPLHKEGTRIGAFVDAALFEYCASGDVQKAE